VGVLAREGGRKFAWKLVFKPFTNSIINRFRVVGLYVGIQTKSHLKTKSSAKKY
jgi:hypothetical protein